MTQGSKRRIAALLSHVQSAAADAELDQQSELHGGVHEPDDSRYDDHVAELAVKDQLPMVVLDMLLPRQRVKLAVENVSHTRMVCTCLESAAASGTAPCFGVVGIDPQTQQPLSFGVECEVLTSALAAGTMQIELVGRRCFAIRGLPYQTDGQTIAKVAWAFAEPNEARDGLAGALTQLYRLTDEWLDLVAATGVEQHPGHIGTSSHGSLVHCYQP